MNDLKLQFEKELWALNPELAVIDTILSKYPGIIEMMKQEVTGGQARGQRIREKGHVDGGSDSEGSDL